MIELDITGIDATVKKLSTPLDKPVKSAARLLAKEALKRIRVYPKTPSSKNKNRFYVRGTGTVYRNKRGGFTVNRTSEKMNLRYKIRNTSDGAEVTNSASYSKWVQVEDTRNHIHGAWKSDREIQREIEPLAKQYVLAELAKAFK